MIDDVLRLAQSLGIQPGQIAIDQPLIVADQAFRILGKPHVLEIVQAQLLDWKVRIILLRDFRECVGIVSQYGRFGRCVIGLILWLPFRFKIELQIRESFAIVALGWFSAALFGSLPFYLSGAIPSYADAFFETMSGFTTTRSEEHHV